jgi:acyl-CoA dehydrogenase
MLRSGRRERRGLDSGAATGLQPIRAFLTPEHELLAAHAAETCAASIATLPPPATDDVARVQARELARALGDADLLASIVPLDLRGCCVVREALGAASPLADAVFALQALGSTPIALAGNDELRQRWLPAVLAGQAIAAFAMTESEAGSDVASMSTTARRDGDGYVIDGAKTFISNAGIADFYTVFAATDASKGSRGISAFVVPADTPGLRFVRAQVMSAPHPLGEIAFDGCRVPASWRLGDEGGGFKVGMMTLDRLRPTVAAAACGMATRALDEALSHATTRRQFGERLADFQLVKEKLARMATDLTAARLLTYRAAWEKDQGAERITLEAAMAKAFATEAAQRIIDDAVQVLGGRGVMADHPVDRLYRAVRSLRIYEGTTEIQYLVIAGLLVGREGTG